MTGASERKRTSYKCLLCSREAETGLIPEIIGVSICVHLQVLLEGRGAAAGLLCGQGMPSAYCVLACLVSTFRMPSVLHHTNHVKSCVEEVIRKQIYLNRGLDMLDMPNCLSFGKRLGHRAPVSGVNLLDENFIKFCFIAIPLEQICTRYGSRAVHT